MTAGATVTIAIPVFNEEAHIDACLAAVERQTYEGIAEVLVVDGGSTDRTRELARAHSGVTVLDNPRRIQAAALNIALGAAKGEVFVRVDGHCVLSADYVERCVEVLEETGASMVGGAMTPVGTGAWSRAVAVGMTSPGGAGPARFHVGGTSGWVDTVYLGAFRTEVARALGGYSEDVGVNEDSELAIRMRARGGVWFDPTIRSTYTPRSSVEALARQFYRYGRSRAATVVRHPSSLAPRQLAAPALLVGLLSPFRRRIAVAYAGFTALTAVSKARTDPSAAPRLVVVLPAMHVSWGAGFLVGLARQWRRFGRRPSPPSPQP